jgi:type II secretory pathway component PulF
MYSSFTWDGIKGHATAWLGDMRPIVLFLVAIVVTLVVVGLVLRAIGARSSASTPDTRGFDVP